MTPAERLARLPGFWRPHMVYDLGDPNGPTFCPASIEDAGNALQEHGWRPRLTEPATVGCLAAWAREVCGDPLLYTEFSGGWWSIRTARGVGGYVIDRERRIIARTTEGDAWAAAIIAKLEAA